MYTSNVIYTYHSYIYRAFKEHINLRNSFILQVSFYYWQKIDLWKQFIFIVRLSFNIDFCHLLLSL